MIKLNYKNEQVNPMNNNEKAIRADEARFWLDIIERILVSTKDSLKTMDSELHKTNMETIQKDIEKHATETLGVDL